jgi:hypothetical protein
LLAPTANQYVEILLLPIYLLSFIHACLPMHNNAMKLIGGRSTRVLLYNADERLLLVCYSWWNRSRRWHSHSSSTRTTQSSRTLTRWSPPVPQVLLRSTSCMSTGIVVGIDINHSSL